MVLIFKLLDDVKDVNNFTKVESLQLVRGNAADVYFRLEQEIPNRSDLRYLPQSGATVQVTFDHIDSGKVVSRVAVQPFPSDDRSVWKVSILATDMLAFNTMQVVLTEGSTVRTVIGRSILQTLETGSRKQFC